MGFESPEEALPFRTYSQSVRAERRVTGPTLAVGEDDIRVLHARWATLRTQLINVPGRVASSARRLTLHLPLDWPWADAWQELFQAATVSMTLQN